MNTKTVKEIEAEVAILMEKAEEIRKIEAADAIASIKAMVETFQIIPSDIFAITISGKFTKSREPNGKAPIKYRNPETNDTWTGRGRAPLWIKDKERALFAV